MVSSFNVTSKYILDYCSIILDHFLLVKLLVYRLLMKICQSQCFLFILKSGIPERDISSLRAMGSGSGQMAITPSSAPPRRRPPARPDIQSISSDIQSISLDTQSISSLTQSRTSGTQSISSGTQSIRSGTQSISSGTQSISSSISRFKTESK